MKHNNTLRNTLIGLTAGAMAFLGTSCGGSKDFTSYNNNIPKSTVENFSPEVYTFNTLIDLVKENADSTVNDVAYKTVFIDLSGTSYTDSVKQKNPVDFLLRYKGNGLEVVKKSIKGNDEFEFYRIGLVKDGKESQLDAKSIYGKTSKENLESHLYNSFSELDKDSDAREYEPQKVLYMLHMFKEQLQGQSIFKDGYKEGQLALPENSNDEESTDPSKNTNTDKKEQDSQRQGF
ncbi:MAG: hypothetical protein ACLFNM_03505 [Candidatus Woesearchaeota archaeon]